jgi:acyl CoA:acetate/3-ketoacid CoA transferase alpha subunit
MCNEVDQSLVRIPAMRTVSIEDAVALIPDGASLMIGGFMAVGTPLRVIDELVRQKKSNLIVICQRHGHAGPGNWQTRRRQAAAQGHRKPYRP